MGERQLVATRAAVGEAAFAEAWEKGRAMVLEEAVACALQDAAED